MACKVLGTFKYMHDILCASDYLCCNILYSPDVVVNARRLMQITDINIWQPCACSKTDCY